MNWIDVKEQCPPEPSGWRKYKLYYTRNESGPTLSYYKGKGKWREVACGKDIKKITHWMEMPEISKEPCGKQKDS